MAPIDKVYQELSHVQSLRVAMDNIIANRMVLMSFCEVLDPLDRMCRVLEVEILEKTHI